MFPSEARDLINYCLRMKPEERPSIEEILNSNFFTNQNIEDPRLIYPYNPYEGNPLLEGLAYDGNQYIDPLLVNLRDTT